MNFLIFCSYLRSIFLVMIFSCVTMTYGQFVQQGSKLVGTGAVGAAYQGQSVAISGDGNTAIVGGPADSSNHGGAWVYTRNAGIWSQQGSKLVGTGGVGVPQQGISVAISADGNTAIVGGNGDSSALGAVWVFTRSGGVWSQEGSKLVGTGAVGGAYQGHSVALSADGNTALVGGYVDSGQAGAAWVFTRSGGVWTQQGSKLVGTGAVGAANQGNSVSLSADGNTALVGGEEDNSELGAAWVFTRSGGVWTQQGSKLVGTGAAGALSLQGHSVSLSGDGNTAILGGYYDDSETGAVWIFTRSGGVWTQQGAKLVGTGAVGGATQGYSVSLSYDGNTAIVGGTADNIDDGAAWVYTRSGGIWTQQGSKLVGTGAVVASQGNSVSLSNDGNTAIVGGSRDDLNIGAAWVFFRTIVGIEFSVQDNWNMVSVPLAVDDFAKSTLFPNAVSSAFAYEGGYVTHDTLENGKGYWLKFDSAQTISQSGLERTWDTVDVQEGWNMMGALSVGVHVDSLSSVPGGLITSPFYEYTGTYNEATTLEPGKGYWVKVSGTGQLIMTSAGSMPQSTRIRILDRGEQPPPPPDGELPNAESQGPDRFMLGQNYPNPFNPSTVIRYQLPVRVHVLLKVYNVFGEEVATLADEVQEAGYKSVKWNAANVASGVYFFRLTTEKFSEVKRMILMK